MDTKRRPRDWRVGVTASLKKEEIDGDILTGRIGACLMALVARCCFCERNEVLSLAAALDGLALLSSWIRTPIAQ